MSNEWYYNDPTLISGYQKFEFGFESDAIILVNDGTGIITFSWNGRDDNGTLTSDDGSIAFDDINQSKIFLKASIGGDARIYAWRRSS